MEVIRQNPALLWAFYIGLFGLLLFVLFNVKRKEREIPVLPVNTNATVAFTETVGRLYLQRKDNHNIADKIITYFYEYLRKKYFINTSVIHKEFINSLSGKSGVSITETTELFELIQSIEPQENISDEELMNLNSKIENFKNQKKHGRKIV